MYVCTYRYTTIPTCCICTAAFYFKPQVRNPEMFQPSNISLMLFCNESKPCSDCNGTEFKEFLDLANPATSS